MRFWTFTLSALVFAGGAAGAVAYDDLTIVSKHTKNGEPAGTATSYLASDHVRMAREDGLETLVDLKTGVMTTLDGKKKTYYFTTKQDTEDRGLSLRGMDDDDGWNVEGEGVPHERAAVSRPRLGHLQGFRWRIEA